MTTASVSTVLALLSFAALLGGFVLVVAGARRPDRRTDLGTAALGFAFAIALVATLGSLYYSGVAHFRPCRLCWWQRIAMYPLVPVLGIGLFRRDRSAAIYALPLAVGGLGWAVYHTQLRWFPGQSDSCEVDAACTSVWVNTFGFVSIPFMAACGFAAIITALILHLRWTPNHTPAQANIGSTDPSSTTLSSSNTGSTDHSDDPLPIGSKR